MNPVVHFEMPAKDRKRMSDFYTNAFGWKTQQFGEDMGNYVLVTTAESDEKGRPKQGGTINGGFYQRTDDPVSHAPSVVIGVENIQDHLKKVTAAGGKLIGEPMEIPGVGTYASFFDTEGNRVSMLQPNAM
ncbi:MAG TPA: VOC family protein [Candidatus Kapabacteria bacterium]|nr:VOC family protein [Candidatus Kapabacteria bacterium]